MDQDQNIVSMLQMFTHAAFRVKNNIVTEVNIAAKQLSIEPGIHIHDLMQTGLNEYNNLHSGVLSLTLCIHDCSFLATVLRIDDSFVFHIQSDYEAEDLQSMALTAQCIREPLSGIMSVSEQFSEIPDYLHSEASKSAILNRNAFRILRILNNMSDAATCKDRTYNMEVLDLAKVLTEIVESSVSLVKTASRTVTIDMLPGTVYAQCDRDMLERAYYNLLSNAIKYSPDHSTIQISVKQTERSILLSLKNACDHLLNEQFGTIFFRYRRQPGIEDGRCGVGLGLSVVRSVASAHNGTLLLSQDSNMDVTFTMSIGIINNHQTLHSPISQIDYAGGRNHGLLELSDVLPAESFIK